MRNSSFLRWAILGTLNTIASVTGLWIFVDVWGVPYWIAATVLHIVLITNLYFLSCRFVFFQKPTRIGIRQFHLTYAAQWVIVIAGLWVLIGRLQLPAAPSQLAVLALAAGFSFAIQRTVIFGTATGSDHRNGPAALAFEPEAAVRDNEFSSRQRGLLKPVSWRLIGGVLAFAAVFVASWLAAAYVMLNVSSLVGDEGHYLAGGRVVWLFVLGDASLSEVSNTIISRGWFTPGMSALLLPLAPFPREIWVARLFMGVLNGVVLLATSWMLGKVYHRSVGIAFFVLITLSPIAMFFSFTLWGDVIGGLGAIWLIVLAERLGQGMRTRREIPKWPAVFGAAVLVAALAYLRPPLILLSLVVSLSFTVSAFEAFRLSRQFVAAMARLGVIAMVSAGLVLPWSAAVTERFDHPYLITTSADLSWIIAFGDRDEVAEIGSFALWHNHVEELAAAQGVSYGTAASIERDRIAANVSSGEYYERVRRKYRQYLMSENAFPSLFWERAHQANPTAFSSPRLPPLLAIFNSLWWRLVQDAYLISILVLAAIKPARRFLVTVVVPVTAIALYFPTVADVHGRHLIDFYPFMAMTIGLAVSAVLATRITNDDDVYLDIDNNREGAAVGKLANS